jgi:hypothetical protein
MFRGQGQSEHEVNHSPPSGLRYTIYFTLMELCLGMQVALSFS